MRLAKAAVLLQASDYPPKALHLCYGMVTVTAPQGAASPTKQSLAPNCDGTDGR